MRGHPYLELLRDRGVGALWIGLATSALGSEIYRVGAIWLAVNLAGVHGSYLAAAQMAAILVTSMFGGAFAELVSRRSLLIGVDLLRAAFSLLIVIIAMTFGLTLPVLIFSSVMLAALGALFSPTLQSSLPQLLADPTRLRATNGLFDATTRSAQVLGPALVAVLIADAPALHLITLNGLSFLASAGAIAAVGHRLDGAPATAAKTRPSLGARLSLGVRAANSCPGAWRILLTTMVRGAAVALGFSVAIPLLFAQEHAGAWISGVTALAFVFAASAAGELGSNVIMAMAHPRRPWRAIFLGYILIGASLAFMGAAQLLAPAPLRAPALIVLALLMGLGNSLAGMQMTTFLGSRLDPDAFAGVLRLRVTLITSASMVTTAAGPWALQSFGTIWTIIVCGLAVVAAASISVMSPGHDRLELAPRP